MFLGKGSTCVLDMKGAENAYNPRLSGPRNVVRLRSSPRNSKALASNSKKNDGAMEGSGRTKLGMENGHGREYQLREDYGHDRYRSVGEGVCVRVEDDGAWWRISRRLQSPLREGRDFCGRYER